jgi:hypothetical protein
MSASLPTKLVPQECAESLMEEDVVATATDEITVLCADGVRIRVDLNLFPSEFLRRLAASDFADKKEVEIPYRADHFYKIYKKYLPAIEEYLQIAPPQLISSHDLLFIRSTKYDDYFYTYHFIIDEKKYQMYFYAGFWPIWPLDFGTSIKKNQINKIIIKLSRNPAAAYNDTSTTETQFTIVITEQSELDFLDANVAYEGRDLSRKLIEYMLNSEKYKAFINANKNNFIV